MRFIAGTLALALGAIGLVACEGSGAGGREVVITQRDDGCTPTSISARTGEKLKVTGKNESGKDPFEIEGIEGTKLEEFEVPKGRTRSAGFTVPDEPGTYKIKCYVPGAVTTIIEVVATAEGASAGVTPGLGSPAPSVPAITEIPRTAPPEDIDTTVAVTLVDYSVDPDKDTIPAGRVRFIATNASATQKHELAVLRVLADGGLQNLGEVEPVGPGQGGTVTLDLTPGAYRLACLIAKGEEGSAVDHYQQGMHTDVTVE
jgi:uncharacterized cupredoxin-like copper-binding protein